MNAFFYNEYGRLRSGFRVAIFFATFIAFSVVSIGISISLLQTLPFGASTASFLLLIIPFAFSSIIALLAGWLYGKLFERLPFRALGISFRGRWLTHFAAGCGVGAVAFICAVIVALASGGTTFSLNRDSSAMAILITITTTFLIFLVGAVSEETFFRGYFLQTLLRSRQVVLGFGVTSLIFALAHNNNPSISQLSLLNTFLAGIWFAAAYLKSHDLWFPLGIHLMWNWLQGPIFGINVSGIAEFSPDPLLKSTDLGPSWLTGGSYGIEGGVACTFAIAVSIALIYFMPRPVPDEEMLAVSDERTIAG